MKRRTLSLTNLTALGSIFLLLSCFGSRDKEAQNTAGAASVESPKNGVTIEAKYDTRLDNLIPGYKIVNVGLTNNGVDAIRLNPLKDKWEITDAYGKNRRAINSLRVKDPRAWGQLPQNLKKLVEYPIAVSMGYTETLDLFYPADVDLTAFRSISFYCAELDLTFDAMTDIDPDRETLTNPPVDKPAGRKKKSQLNN
jgi:hypothetical protein